MSARILMDGATELRSVVVSQGQEEYGVELQGNSSTVDNLRITSGPAFSIADVFVDSRFNHLRGVNLLAPETTGILVANHDNHIQAVINGVGSSLNTSVIVSGDRNIIDIQTVGTGDVDSGTIVVSGNNNVIRGILSEPDRHGIVITGNNNRIDLTIVNLAPNFNNTLDLFHLTGTASGNMIQNCRGVVDDSGNLCRSGVFMDTNTTCNFVVGNYLGDDYGTDPIIDNGTDNQIIYPADPQTGDNLAECPPSMSA